VGGLSLKRACLLRQLSGFESRHLSKMGDTSKGAANKKKTKFLLSRSGRNRKRNENRAHLRGSTVMKSGWTSLHISVFFFSHAVKEKSSNEHKKVRSNKEGRLETRKKCLLFFARLSTTAAIFSKK